MSEAQTWFEVKIDHDLAIMFQRIVNVYSRTGKAKRGELLARLAAAIAAPPQDGSLRDC